jgi:hypothetical protein
MINISPIPLSKIIPIYSEQLDKKYVSQLTKLIQQGNIPDSLITVEYNEEPDEYYLIAGFPEYQAYLNTQFKRPLCVVRPLSNKTTRRLILLRRMFQHQKSKWMDKHILIYQFVTERKSTR